MLLTGEFIVRNCRKIGLINKSIEDKFLEKFTSDIAIRFEKSNMTLKQEKGTL